MSDNTSPASARPTAGKEQKPAPEVRTQHVFDPQTGKKKPFQVKIVRGGRKRPETR